MVDIELFFPQQLHNLLALGSQISETGETPPPFLLVAVLLTQAVLESQIKGCHLQRAPLPRSSHIAHVNLPICIAFRILNAQLSGLSSVFSLSSILTLDMLHHFATALSSPWRLIMPLPLFPPAFSVNKTCSVLSLHSWSSTQLLFQGQFCLLPGTRVSSSACSA